MKVSQLTLEMLSSESEKILKTLPIAHYLKVDTIPVVFDNLSSTSYFNPSEFTIHVALANIADAIIGSGKNEITNADLEKTIRCFLYHEISHAILTPKNLMTSANGWTLLNPTLANILEDERIETLLSNYYHNVDFKENLHNVVKLQQARDFTSFVFNAVRFRYCPINNKDVNNHVNDFIKKTSHIGALSGDEYYLCSLMEKLIKYLKGIWDSLPKSTSKSASKQPSEATGDGDGEGTQSEETSSTSNEDEEKATEQTEEKGKSQDSSCEDEQNDDKNAENAENDSLEDSSSRPEEEETSNEENAENEKTITLDECEDADSPLSDEEIEQAVAEVVLLLKQESADHGKYTMKIKDFQCDNNTKVELLKVIVRNVGTGIHENQAQYGYSGRFNAKRFMKDYNDSCKWFEKRAYEDNQKSKKSSRKILNIWLDQSGSFRSNDDAVNNVLKALYEIEKKRNDFEWNLIRVDEHFTIENDKEKRYSKSSGGNALPKEEIEKCYKQLNKTGYEYNIVLFDGEVGDENAAIYLARVERNYKLGKISQHDYEYYKKSEQDMDYQNLKVFDNKRSIFIVERSNIRPIKTVCSNAKSIIEQNSGYANALAKNTIKALDLLF